MSDKRALRARVREARKEDEMAQERKATKVFMSPDQIIDPCSKCGCVTLSVMFMADWSPENPDVPANLSCTQCGTVSEVTMELVAVEAEED